MRMTKRQRLMAVCEKKVQQRTDERAVKKVGCKSGWSISRPRPLITSLFWCNVVQCIRMISRSSVAGAHLRTTPIAIKIARKAFETTFERFSEFWKRSVNKKWRGIPRTNKTASAWLVQGDRLRKSECIIASAFGWSSRSWGRIKCLMNSNELSWRLWTTSKHSSVSPPTQDCRAEGCARINIGIVLKVISWVSDNLKYLFEIYHCRLLKSASWSCRSSVWRLNSSLNLYSSGIQPRNCHIWLSDANRFLEKYHSYQFRSRSSITWSKNSKNVSSR